MVLAVVALSYLSLLMKLSESDTPSVVSRVYLCCYLNLLTQLQSIIFTEGYRQSCELAAAVHIAVLLA